MVWLDRGQTAPPPGQSQLLTQLILKQSSTVTDGSFTIKADGQRCVWAGVCHMTVFVMRTLPGLTCTVCLMSAPSMHWVRHLNEVVSECLWGNKQQSTNKHQVCFQINVFLYKRFYKNKHDHIQTINNNKTNRSLFIWQPCWSWCCHGNWWHHWHHHM